MLRIVERGLRTLFSLQEATKIEVVLKLIHEANLMASTITYRKGDATAPQGDGPKIIAHCCNDIGAWGKGFVMALSAKWSEAEDEYRGWYEADVDFALGEIQLVQVEPHLWVANMIGQHGIRRSKSGPPIRYDAIRECLSKLAVEAKKLSASVHMPRIGCGLAGGKWDQIEPVIVETLCANDVAVTVYDFA
jgi:O-acetyl-ADP-ribose deacetylase (regulator of RNase III)